MKESTALEPVNSQVEAIQAAQRPTVIELIKAAMDRPDFDVEKLERLIALQERMDAREAEREFDDAMARVQRQIPQIDRLAKGQNSRYARIEDIDIIVRPLLAVEGISRSLTEESRTEDRVWFALKLKRSGHTDITRGSFAIDEASKNSSGKAIRTPTQDDGSTRSYAERYLLCDALGIVTRGVDNDGARTEVISKDQVRDIEIALKDTKSDTAGFLKYMGVASISEIRLVDLKKATTAIEQKRRELAKS